MVRGTDIFLGEYEFCLRLVVISSVLEGPVCPNLVTDVVVGRGGLGLSGVFHVAERQEFGVEHQLHFDACRYAFVRPFVYHTTVQGQTEQCCHHHCGTTPLCEYAYKDTSHLDERPPLRLDLSNL